MSGKAIFFIIMAIVLLLLIGSLIGFYFYERHRRQNSPVSPVPPVQPSPPVSPTTCPAYYTIDSSDISGFNELVVNNLATQDDCSQACSKNPNCSWYNYDPNNKVCYLKKTVATPNTTTTFRIRNTGNYDKCSQWAPTMNGDIPGFDIKDVSNNTEDECKQECIQYDCDWYNYNNDSKSCHLKKTQKQNGILTSFRTGSSA
ncbi:putative PAN domain-containing protein [Acanthamoeba polyphaga mimivirus]|uniref:PAN domain-containing protein n=1 Tax=Acanthamoeba polyphaga mimivirus Kroon TaxID=3069720 RepID=A0A0G2Y7I9_9VIRU|nr:putative PAN domain-containing protein [Acanthamoeba polyphaga mimivirus]AKI80509.1 putative PAN domain-containing protein [Acanthamoeba polyphaga mimivirus Kroon]